MRSIWISLSTGSMLMSAVCLAGTIDIDQVGQKFSQSALAVARGDLVHFINHDDVTHNIGVIDDNDNSIDKGLQKPGESIEQKFDAAGKFMIRCSIHPKMKMTIAVK